MSKNCNLPYKTAEANAKAYLRTKGVIDKYLNILDYPKFVKENRKLTEAGIKNYDINTQWFFAEQGGTKAVPNTKEFRYVDSLNSFDDPNIFKKEGEINYVLKAVDILSSDKAKQVFEKGKKNNWNLNKILTELQIPKEQKQIILDKNWQVLNQARIGDLKSFDIREEIITSLLADNSFVVEINTTKDSYREQAYEGSTFEYNDKLYQSDNFTREYWYKDNNTGKTKFITASEFRKAFEEYTKKGDIPNSSYYSNLTVPGGTNYTENEIATPGIIPNIKGHAQFSTDNGIGWFRSDDKKGDAIITEQDIQNSKEAAEAFDLPYNEKDVIPKSWKKTKTRRILEIQSDLFQKGRNKDDLIGGHLGQGVFNEETGEFEEDERWGVTQKSNENQNNFLQLLNKKNNWVTFFVKSIIQDSAKKGYEKVLFPKGDTAAKIEGHQTLEEFKKHKKDRIKKLESKMYSSLYSGFKNKHEVTLKENNTIKKLGFDFNSKEEANKKIEELKEKNNSEIQRLKQELADVESGQTQLSSIANFYETTITNVLNKQYKGRTKDVIDEYGNGWTEVELKVEDTNQPFVLSLKSLNSQKKDSFSQKFIFGNKKKKSEPIREQNFELSDENKTKNANEIREKLFNGNLTNQTANQFLRNALYNIELNDNTRQIVKSLLATRAKIKFVSKSALVDNFTYVQYNPDNRTIQVNRDILSTGNLYYAFDSILHEIVHDFTVQSITNPKNDKQREFRNFIQEQYKFFTDKSNEYHYGFTNEAEFVAEIMSNEVFRDHLRTLENNSNTNIIKRFINALRRLFGFTNKDNNVDKIIESILEISRTEYGNYQSLSDLNYVFKKEGEKSKKNKYSDKFKKELLDTKSLIKDLMARIEAVKNKSRVKKGYKNKNQQKFTELQELLEELYEKSSNEALYEFTNFANKEINNLLANLDKKIKSNEITSDYLIRAQSYISVYSSIKDIQVITNRQFKAGELTQEEYNKIKDALKEAKDNFDQFHADYIDLGRDILAKKLAPFNNRPLIKRKRELEKEYKSLKLTQNREDWINDKLDEEIDDLRQQALEQTRKQLEVIPMDIGSNVFTLVSEKNMNNLIIQLTSFAIDNLEIELRDFTVGLRQEYYKKNKEYNPIGTTNKTKYGKLLSQDSSGNYYLISEYSPKFLEEYQAEQKKVYDANEEFGFKSKESRIAWKKFVKWKKANIDTVYNRKTGHIVSQKPVNKWKDKRYDKLDSKDKEYLNYLKNKAKEADELTQGYKSLIFKYVNNEFIRLPSIRRTDLDKLLSGKVVDLTKEKVGDISKVREDDTTRGELTNEEIENQDIVKKLVTINNEERLLVPIHFRNKINPKDQSLDLPTIFLLNSSMAKEYQLKQSFEADSSLIIDVVGASKVIKTEPFTNKIWKSIFSNSKDELADIKDDGINSNVYKKINSMIENRVYKITQVTSGKLFGRDIAQIANGVASYSANLSLAVNYLSAIPNLMQGKIQNFIEGVGNGVFTRADLRWAEKTYFKEMANGGINDIGSNVNQSKLFMLIDKFNLMGDFNAIKNAFEDNNKFRALFKTNTLHGLNNAAEHYVQSTLMLAIMKSIKIKNRDGKYINKDGKIVDKKDAMNLYEAFDVTDFGLKMNKNAHHSSFSRNPFSKLGMLEHQSLIKKKIIDLHGQYDTRLQSDIQRYWWGKLIFMFRKWLIPAYHRRWRGAIYSNKSYDELTENQKFYDDSLQEYNEGMYTSFIRFFIKGVIPAIKEFKIELAKTNWNELTDMEKGNIHKTLRELLVTALMMTASYITYLAAQDADEDDEVLLYTLAYLFKRQETELMQYYHPQDQMRIFRTPFAAMSTVEKTFRWLNQMTPMNIGEVYEKGPNKDQYKAWIKAKRLIPVISQTERTAQQSLSYLKSISE